MQFRFDESRATQAVAFLLRKWGGQENYTKLLKVLYLADRKSLLERGTPFVGASFCNMKNGPLASDVYNQIKGDKRGDYWAAHVETKEYDLVLIKDPGDDDLSEYQEELLEGLFKKYRNHTYSQMINIVHKLREWDKSVGNSSRPLEPEVILKAADVPQEKIDRFEALDRQRSEVQQLISG